MVYDKWQHVLYSKQHIQTRLATDFLLPLSLGWLELRPHQCGLVHTVVISFTVLLIIIIIIIISSLHPDYFLYRALEAACAAYASLNLSLLHYITLHYITLAVHSGMEPVCQQYNSLKSGQFWPSWYLQVQLGRASAWQVMSTNWTDLLTDAKQSNQTTPLNNLIKLINLSSKLFYLTIIRGHNFALPTIHVEFNKRHFVARVFLTMFDVCHMLVLKYYLGPIF